MATDVELENLIVRLTGDGSQYQQMLKEAQTSSQKAADGVEAATKRIEAHAQGLQAFAGAAMSALGNLGLALSLKGAFDKYAEYEKAQIGLNAAIVAGGHNAETTVAQYSAFASQITATTLHTKGETFALLKRAEMMGYSGAQAEKLVSQSFALAAVGDREASSMLRAVDAMQRGNYQMAARMLGIRGIKDHTELATRVNAMMMAGMKVEEALYDSSAGKLERLGRSFGGLTREIGGLVAQAILPLVEKLEQGVKWFNSLDATTRSTIATVIALTLAYGPLKWAVTTFLVPLMASVTGLYAQVAAMVSGTAGIGTYIVAIAAAAYGLYRLSQALYNARTDVKALNALFDAQQGQAAGVSTRYKAETDAIVGQATAIENREERRIELQRQLAETNRNIRGREANVSNAQRERDQANSWGSFNWLTGHAELDRVARQLQLARDALKDARDRAAALQAALAGASDVAILQSIEELNKKLREQVETFGMSHNEIEIFKLKKAGATEAQLAETRGLDEYLKLLKEGKQTMERFLDPVDKFLKRQEELGKMLNAGTITLEVYDKAMQDARKHVLEHASAHQKLQGSLFGSADALDKYLEYQDRLNAVDNLIGQRRGAGDQRGNAGVFNPQIGPAGVPGGVVPVIPAAPGGGGDGGANQQRVIDAIMETNRILTVIKDKPTLVLNGDVLL